MASGHGVDKPRKEGHPNRQVSRGSFGQGERLSKFGGQYIATGSVTPEMEDQMSHQEWLSHMTSKHGHSGT